MQSDAEATACTFPNPAGPCFVPLAADGAVSGYPKNPNATGLTRLTTGLAAEDAKTLLKGQVVVAGYDAGGRRAVSTSDDKTLKVWDVASGTTLAAYTSDGGRVIFAVAPDGRGIVVGDARGRVYGVGLEGITPGPAVVMAWRERVSITRSVAPRWRFWRRPSAILTEAAILPSLAFGCLHCRTWSEIPESAMGTELPCPHCGKPAKLNPFVIEADWRPVAAAWKEESLDQGREER